MNPKWIDPKIVTGPTATGEYYYPRPEIEAEIWHEIAKGGHVLLAAPRRVGKTSVMLAMLENQQEDTRCEFKNIQGIKSENEFYREFFELMVRCLDKFKKGKFWLDSMFKGITIEEITLQGVKFGSEKPLDHAAEIERLLPKIADQKLQIVLLLDELPEVLNGLHKNKRTEEASAILNRLRQWRQHPDIRKCLSLVLAGSVGIHHIVKTIEGRTADINDFAIVSFEPLTRDRAADYIARVTHGATVQYDDNLTNGLLDKVNHYIPYFLNLMLDEINRAARATQNPAITQESIGSAFDAIVKNNKNFSDWKNRLTDYFPVKESDFLDEVLTFIAHKDSINTRQLYDIAHKHEQQRQYMELIGGLESDGYIVEQAGNYRFVSPFLQAFWMRNNPIYD
ncbi:MAG: AAA-like domain-containing protein [Saprospiraceae bacterium]|nr:AAA-like domain-containing protein [Saprospiraceae bacterium]